MTRRQQTTATSPVRRRKTGGEARLRFLVLVHGPDRKNAAPEWYALGERSTTIGREPGEGGITLDDLEASRSHAEVSYSSELDVFRVRDLGSRNRTHIDAQVIQDEYLHHGSVIRIGSSLLVYSEVALPPGVSAFAPQGIGSLALFMAHAAADLAAPSTLPILIHGPTGSGKELLARRIHEQSGRTGQLVTVNCSTFTRELIGSELFGHTAGAFSGAATARKGLFTAANKGTLFLDEIAELPLDQQPALLRVLQEGKIRAIGADTESAVDVRVVAATHQDLAERVVAGDFREDLHARLSGFTVAIAPLSERREEIAGLFTKFLGARALPLEVDAAEALLLYDWPQNVRELKHVAERTRLLASGRDRIELEVLPAEIQKALPEAAPEDDAPTKAQLEALLTTHAGSVANVSRALGKHRQQVYRWLKRYDLDATKFRPE